MSIIGKIGREIGEEVAEGLAKKASPKVMPDVKKPLEWGFKGRKPTDIEDLNYNMISKEMGPKASGIVDRNRKKLNEGAKKNKYIDEFTNYIGSLNEYDYPHDLRHINDKFRFLEKIGAPRELTGKMLGSKFTSDMARKLKSERVGDKARFEKVKNGWLRYYNELDDKQKETFDILSDEWDGTIDELVDAAKLL
jgi:hypothetical protein